MPLGSRGNPGSRSGAPVSNKKHVHRYLIPTQPAAPVARCLNTNNCDERYRLMVNVLEGDSPWTTTSQAIAANVARSKAKAKSGGS
jgi:hypothetical protein